MPRVHAKPAGWSSASVAQQLRRCIAFCKCFFSGQEKNNKKHRVFERDIPQMSGRISERTSRPKKHFHPIAQSAGKSSFFCADIHDPKVRTSMTREGLRKTLCRNITGYLFVTYTYIGTFWGNYLLGHSIDSLHNSHVVHCAPRVTLAKPIFCV